MRPRKERTTGRPNRTPLHARNRLTVTDGTIPKGMTGRWINDKDDRVKAALEAGYEFVRGDVQVGDPNVSDASQLGSPVEKMVGGGTKAFLMMIPSELYADDQAEKQETVDASERAMKPNPGKHQYGAGLTND
jgi:hypothetical protein